MVLFLISGRVYAQSVEEYCVKGVEYGAQGKFEEAEKEFKKALEVDPSYASAEENLKLIKDVLEKRVENEFATHLFKGLFYENQWMLAEATSDYDSQLWLDVTIAEYKKAIAINPNYAMANNNLGVAYYNKGMLDEAITEYKKAITINPNHAKAHANLGLAYVKGKRMFDEAISECKKAIAINSNLANAHSNLGLAYVGKKMYDEAIAEYKKAIAIEPNLAVACNNLAVAYYAKKEYDLAIEYCDRAIGLGYKVHPGFLKDLKPYRK